MKCVSQDKVTVSSNPILSYEHRELAGSIPAEMSQLRDSEDGEHKTGADPLRAEGNVRGGEKAAYIFFLKPGGNGGKIRAFGDILGKREG